jgi:hypothetical protein
MLLKDYKTPEGRIVKVDHGDPPASPCRVRKMTKKEREHYGKAENKPLPMQLRIKKDSLEKGTTWGT